MPRLPHGMESAPWHFTGNNISLLPLVQMPKAATLLLHSRVSSPLGETLLFPVIVGVDAVDY